MNDYQEYLSMIHVPERELEEVETIDVGDDDHVDMVKIPRIPKKEEK